MKIFHRITGITIAFGAAITLLIGCSSSSSSESVNTDATSGYGIYGKTEDTTAGPTNTASQIEIEGSSFSVAGYVTSTEVLTVTNHDGFTHTVTADDGAFDVSVTGGATVSLPPLNPGTYPFHCRIHTSMRGTITVV